LATLVYKDCKLYVAQYDLSAQHNQLTLNYKYEELDNTTFGCAVRSRTPGLADARYEGNGFFQADGTSAIDDVLWTNFTTADVITTVCPSDGVEAGVAYSLKQTMLEYTPITGTVGELLGFSVAGNASASKMVRGTIMEAGNVTTTSTSTPYQLGAVTTAQYVYCIMHVTAKSGTSPTLDVVLQSDSAEAFESPATRISMTQATAATSQWATPVAGEITDTWWRLSYTVGGTNTPTFSVVIVTAIGS
jgi:hypothetical protein